MTDAAHGNLTGWHVVEVGVRQAWPFVGFAHRDSGGEVRLYIDAGFSVLPTWPVLDQDSSDVFVALGAINMHTVTASAEVDGSLVIELETNRLTVSGDANELTTGPPWWIATLDDQAPRA